MLFSAFVYISVLIILKGYIPANKADKWVNIIHIIITFFIFEYYFMDFYIFTMRIFDSGLYEFPQNYASIFSTSFNAVIIFVYYLASFFMSIFILWFLIARRGRKMFLYVSIVMSIISTLDISQAYSYTYKDDDLRLILFVVGGGVTLFYGTINLFYNTKNGRKLFKLIPHESEENY